MAERLSIEELAEQLNTIYESTGLTEMRIVEHKASGGKYRFRCFALVEADLKIVAVYSTINLKVTFTRPVGEFVEKFSL